MTAPKPSIVPADTLAISIPEAAGRLGIGETTLFFDHDAPTLEDILEGGKLMDAERKRVFAVPPY
jgi:hypothetical protein